MDYATNQTNFVKREKGESLEQNRGGVLESC